MEKIARFAIRFRYPIVFFFLIITIILGLQIPKMQFDPNIVSMLPDHIDAKQKVDKIEELFGGSEFIIIGVESENITSAESLQRLEDLTYGLEEVYGIEKVLSLMNINNIQGEGGDLLVTPLVENIPETKEEEKTLRSRIANNDLAPGTVINTDFTAAAILGFITQGIDDTKLLHEVEQMLKEEYPGEERVYIGGLPLLRAELAAGMQNDMRIFVPIGLLIMLVFLFLSFKELRGVMLPFLIVVMSIIAALGTASLLGWKIQLIIIILPVILIAVANDYGIHLLARYQQEVKLLSPGKEAIEGKHRLIAKVTGSLRGPVLGAGITTIAGFLTLLSHIIVPARQLGFLAALGILFALTGSLVLIPALLAILPVSRYSEKQRKPDGMDRFLLTVSVFVHRKYKSIVILSVLGAFLLATGMVNLEINTDPIHFFGKNNPVSQSDDYLSRNFGGTTNINIVASGDIKDPETMKNIHRMEQMLSHRESIGQTTSIARIIRTMNKVMNDDDPEFDRIPDTREAIAQYFLLYSFSGDPEDFDKLVDFNYQNALITARLAHPSSKSLKTEFDNIYSWLEENPENPFTVIGGFGEILSDLSTLLAWGQIKSLGLAVLLVALIIALLFKNGATGVLSTIPLIGAILILFGLMGYLNIALSTITTMLTAVMIGVGVDYTIHFLWHYKQSRKRGLSAEEGISHTLSHSGRGIVFNALSVVVGFLVLMISNFLPVRFFGFLIVISISTCLVGALVFLPSLILWIRPEYFEPQTKKGRSK